MPVPLDSTAENVRFHEDAYRALGMGGRLKIAMELSDLTHSFAIAGIKRRHPEGLSDLEARVKLAELLYTSEPAR